MNKKIALITGASGQDGSYLAQFLIKKNYKVVAVDRKSSRANTCCVSSPTWPICLGENSSRCSGKRYSS